MDVSRQIDRKRRFCIKRKVVLRYLVRLQKSSNTNNRKLSCIYRVKDFYEYSNTFVSHDTFHFIEIIKIEKRAGLSRPIKRQSVTMWLAFDHERMIVCSVTARSTTTRFTIGFMRPLGTSLVVFH